MPETSPSPSALRKGWRFLRLLAQPHVARKLGTLSTEGYLAQTGWTRSAAQRVLVDAKGEPQPWMTLPFIAFIAPRLRADWTVFEFGAGESTRFYAARVQHVVTVEHNEIFAAHLRPRLPANVTLFVRTVGSEAYVRAAAEASSAVLVSVDGRDRVRCVERTLPGLDARAAVVLDDAERSEYAPAAAMLKAAGFRAVEFWGVAPGGVTTKCTTVFYRDGNVLGL